MPAEAADEAMGIGADHHQLHPIGPHTWSLHGRRGMLVSINLDIGEATFGDGYDLDEAVKAFFEASGRKFAEAKVYDLTDGHGINRSLLARPG